ncbi:hypothetical protein HELRODRAFT_183276 [Helobdella robusta]|uniref:Uncharacterized protein n=1 Tax=Helobdella robusta TaxID=6412 RepID=T1FJE6_HELRO|nr:hypothetical protein HELRODRAFT_183276 [Helobdella robusta]ESO11333.1 hypothetical protein HELRODRAFT_183276 [Helobdella robusta]
MCIAWLWGTFSSSEVIKLWRHLHNATKRSDDDNDGIPDGGGADDGDEKFKDCDHIPRVVYSTLQRNSEARKSKQQQLQANNNVINNSIDNNNISINPFYYNNYNNNIVKIPKYLKSSNVSPALPFSANNIINNNINNNNNDIKYNISSDFDDGREESFKDFPLPKNATRI